MRPKRATSMRRRSRRTTADGPIISVTFIRGRDRSLSRFCHSSEHFNFSRERARQLELRAKSKLKLELQALAVELDWATAAAPAEAEDLALA